MSNPSNQYYFEGHEITLTWIRSDDITTFKPITQVYAIIFNDEKEILICRKGKKSEWHIPGGTVENDEKPKETLIREVLEEVDIEVSKIASLGVQKVEFPDNPNESEKKVFYQARLIAKVKKILPQTPDPDSGVVWERKFVPASQIKEFIKWEKTGDAMFDDAIILHQSMSS